MPIKSKWIPFKKETIKALPLNQSGVYEVGKAEEDIVLYIGKSDTCIRARLLDHKEKTKFQKCTHFRKQKTDPDEAVRVERKLQLAYKKRYGKLPLLNKITSPRDLYEGILY